MDVESLQGSCFQRRNDDIWWRVIIMRQSTFKRFTNKFYRSVSLSLFFFTDMEKFLHFIRTQNCCRQPHVFEFGPCTTMAPKKLKLICKRIILRERASVLCADTACEHEYLFIFKFIPSFRLCFTVAFDFLNHRAHRASSCSISVSSSSFTCSRSN